MATIADNIHSMAELVSSVKRTHRLTETTVMRIVDMNFALAQGTNQQSFSGDEEFPMDSPIPLPENDDEQLTLFPETDEETADALGIQPETDITQPEPEEETE